MKTSNSGKSFLLGDYFKIKFPSNQFNGIITDIPYKGCITNKLGEKEFSFENFLVKTNKETQANAFLITFCNFLCSADLIAAAKSTNWRYHTHQIWDKRPVRTWISWGHPLRHTEYIVYFTKGDFKYDFRTGVVNKPYKRKSFGGVLKTGIVPNNRDKSYEMFHEILTFPAPRKKIHPTEKPLEFSAYFKQIIGFDAYVLDPFMGSGNLVQDFTNSVGVDIVDYQKENIYKKLKYKSL